MEMKERDEKTGSGGRSNVHKPKSPELAPSCCICMEALVGDRTSSAKATAPVVSLPCAHTFHEVGLA